MISESPSDFRLYLEVQEATRYTTTMRLTYFLNSDVGVVADPDLSLRLYHDAGQLEAMACAATHCHDALRSFSAPGGGELQRRWSRNMMLNKWLEYCADQGHDFARAVAQAWIAGSSEAGLQQVQSSNISVAGPVCRQAL